MEAIQAWYSKIGKRGGASTSKRKRDAARRNGSMAQRPHMQKTRHFLKWFPHPLESVEWKVKWPIKHADGKTYNPDFWCEKMQCYIELATSCPNISQNRIKWKRAMKLGHALKVYWWEGGDISKHLDNSFKWIKLHAQLEKA